MKRSIWTRLGRVELPNSAISGGFTQQDVIAEYAQRQSLELRGPTEEIYLRAYRRAGLLPGDPDEITTQLPSEREQVPAESAGEPPSGASGTPTPPTARTAPQRDSGANPAAPAANPPPAKESP